MKHSYSVLVGNIGTTLETGNGAAALREFGQWKRASKARCSRASGEPVTLFRDGEPWREYSGPLMTFDEALEAINDERWIDHSQVSAAALRRNIWIAEWHIPGRMSESRSYCLTKRDAIESALGMASDENGPPRGMRADLMRYGSSDKVSADAHVSMAVTTVSRCTLRNILYSKREY